MRIVSLLPAVTEWVCAFGAGGDLVGRSHECDTPASVQDVPVVTRPTYDSHGDSAAIDDAVQNQLQQGLSLYAVDLEQLRALAPDLILTQAQCEVCAVSRPQLEETLADWSGAQPQVLSMEPMTLKEVLDAALRIGRTIGQPEMAMQVLAAKERALQRLRNRMGLHRRTDPATLPTIACIEWMEPLMTAGHWMPDVAEMAGARAVLAEKGAPSRVIEWEALCAADPDVIAVLPCGFTLAETRRDLHYLTERDGWADLRAVRSDRVVLLDGNAYFNRPGPRLYRSIELLAEGIHPDAVDAEALAIEAWERQRLRDVASIS
jgi:iron complex transport system substrate-binding protein